MKTPRELLLEQHRAAMPKLDAVRRDVLSGLKTEQSRRQNFLVALIHGGLNQLWRELILPSRYIWTGLATTWVLLLGINVALHDPAPSGKLVAVPVMISFSEQQRLMNDLFAGRSPALDADRSRIFLPKPRTEKIWPATV